MTDIWMPFYIGTYTKNTMHLSTEEHGAYLLLIMHYWCNGKIPRDENILRNITRISPKKLRNVLAFFRVEGSHYIHDKINEEREKAFENKNKKSEAGKKGMASRYNKDLTPVITELQQSYNPSPSPSPDKGKPLSKGKPQTLDLPDWLDLELWGNFIEHRKFIKSPLSVQSAKVNLTALEKIVSKGYTQEEVINLAIGNGWKSFYEPKKENHGTSKQNNGQGYKPAKQSITDATREAYEAALRGEL